MKLVFTSLFVITSCIQTAYAQKKLPAVKATSLKVDIKVDGEREENAWTIVPTEKLDVYETSGKRVTFYTDIDSITVNVNPKVGTYDFIIVVNGKDSAHTQIKYKPSYLDKLKKAAAYNYLDKRAVPAFSYQATDNANLVKIRTTLKLDSIAGKGSELSKIFNLMHWVHTTIRHDGNSNNPTSKNAIDLVSVCKTENRGVNCRMMATVLNECYLALGIKSRYITCMPRETDFDDCHVINMVYSTELKKWIWIDPTFDAYVMDEKGELLGIAEVRERLISGKPLILNRDANWNKQNLQTIDDYLKRYMAKNLYRLECPLLSESDTETWKNGKEITYIELLPLDGLVQEPQKKEETNAKTGVKFIHYITNNPKSFWTTP